MVQKCKCNLFTVLLHIFLDIEMLQLQISQQAGLMAWLSVQSFINTGKY